MTIYKTKLSIILISLILLSVTSVYAQFTEVTIPFTGIFQGSVVWGDFDNDDDLDLLYAGAKRTYNVSGIYRNEGGTFVHHAGFIGVQNAKADWGDYDNDGDLDVLIYGMLFNHSYASKLYRNDNGTFIDTNVELPTGTYRPTGWVDYDKDGDLDIYLTGNGIKIYINHNGAFVDSGEIIPGSGDVYWIDYDNDGDLDASKTNAASHVCIYRNDNGIFVETALNLPNPVSGSLVWGDYDSDGDFDAFSLSSVVNIYRNDAGLFLLSGSLPGAEVGYWGDYDNDGDLDILLSGNGSSGDLSEIYRNDDGAFVPISAGFFSPRFSAGAWGDYDNDGDLDVLLAGILPYDGLRVEGKLYRNDSTTTNSPPAAPFLTVDTLTGELIATGAADDTTPSSCLSYGLRIGTTPGSIDVASPMSDLSTGYRKIARRGLRSLRSLDLTPECTYYAAVQTIDNGFQGSLFSNEVTFMTPPIQLTYPSGGEILVSGSTSYIRWSANNVWSLKLKLSTDNGVNWVDISVHPVSSAPGIYYYTVPSANSTQCRVKIAWAKDDSYFDICPQQFTITTSSTAPSISLTAPSLSDIFASPGSMCHITWTSQNVSAVSLDYTTDNGNNWYVIAQNIPSLPACYNWITPDSVTDQARIRIRKSDNSNCYDISDNPFIICSVEITSPNGGEVLTGDYSGSNTHTINWTAPFVTNLDFFYSLDNGNAWTYIATLPGSLRQYSWTIPTLESSQCRIKATHSIASEIFDVSDTTFTIRIPVKLVNCNGGGFVNNNSYYNVRWKLIDINPSEQMYLEYSADNSTWTRTNSSPILVSVLQYSAFLDLANADQVWFRIIVAATNIIIAKSTTSMTVTPKQLHLSSPQIGDTVGIESYVSISWTADGCTNLDIFYTVDFGNTWLPIISNVPSTQLNYVWHVPNTASSSCRIKLQDTSYTYMNIESDGEFSIVPTSFSASFTADVTSGFSDLVVHYTDLSIGYISSWEWDLDGDGQVDSEIQNPMFIYRQSGLYSITLTIYYGSYSVSSTRSNYIYVLPMVADFTVTNANGFCPLTTQFNDQTASDITEMHWDFNNDGQIDSDSGNPIWTYLFPGTYTVSQTVSNGLDSDTEIKENYITVSLNPAITRYVPTQYLTIQAAVDASNNGDYIIIANGTYYENLLLEGKDITLASYYFIDGDSSHIANTIIDGSNAINPDQASTITILPGTGRPVISPHVVGFTIRGGSGRRIVQNQGESTIEKRVGGGIYTRSASPIFSFNRIEDNDADDEGGGSYAFQSLPNHGGMVDPAIGIYNPGGNYFANNHADIGADIYIDGVTVRDPIKFQNCSFAVISEADTTVSNYWVTTSSALSFDGSTGREPAITTDVYVATNGSDTLNNGLSPQTPFKTIDHALSRIYASEAAALTIHIASGTYSPSLTAEKFPLQMVKNVSLQGAGKDETFLDAEGSADFPRRVINLDNVTDVSISDLTLMNGFVTMTKNYNGGGIGIISSHCNLSGLRLAGSSAAGNGAGIYAFQSSVLADSISLEYNTALGSGGGICVNSSDLEITQAQISHNSANKNGAGIFADGGQIHISHSDISQNQAIGYLSKGGGISLSNTDQALIYANSIFSNNADNGAGIYLQSNQALKLDRNRIANNLADYSGGGLFVNTSTGLFTNNLIVNNTASQRGGAIYCYSSPQLYSNTIAYNKAGIEGGGMYLNGASPDIQNSIIWANVRSNPEVPSQVYLFGDTSDPNISYCDLQGGNEGIMLSPGAVYNGSFLQNMDQFPLFLDPPEGSGSYFVAGEAGFSLITSSPCADQGNPTTDITDYPLDIIGYSRIANNRIDLGSYETFAYNGAVISASASMLDFGRVRVGATPASTNLTLFNHGSQDLQITNISMENPGTDFGFEVSGHSYMIPIGGSIELQISFTPSTGGVRSNSLLIHNNSQNSPLFQIELTGTGIDDGTSLPSNVLLEVLGNDVRLTWNQVLSDQWGNPFEPSGYLVFGSDRADAPIDDFLLISYTEQPIFIHRQIARLKDRMFYAVVALDDGARSKFTGLSANSRDASTLSWQEIRSLLHLTPGGVQKAE